MLADLSTERLRRLEKDSPQKQTSQTGHTMLLESRSRFQLLFRNSSGPVDTRTRHQFLFYPREFSPPPETYLFGITFADMTPIEK